MANYIGTTLDQIYNQIDNRYFYGLRRTDEGELFLGKVDQLSPVDSVTINNPGDPSKNYPNYDEGQSFFEGRDAFHNLIYENLNYEQYRWDNSNLYYYINEEGELVVRVNQRYIYDDSVSSDGK